MDKFKDGLNIATRNINSLFGNKEPWQIAAITASTVLTSVWIWDVLNQDECKCSFVFLIYMFIKKTSKKVLKKYLS